jgi:hypothetical protein
MKERTEDEAVEKEGCMRRKGKAGVKKEKEDKEIRKKRKIEGRIRGREQSTGRERRQR